MSKPIDRGYGYGFRWSVVDALGAKEALSGAVIEWKLAASDSSPVLLSRETADMTVSIPDATVSFTLTRAETGGLAVGRYYFQLAIQPAGKESEIYDSGFVTVRARL